MKSISWKYILAVAVALCFVGTISTASAATVSGTIYGPDGTGLGDGSIQVRLWEETPKGYQIAYETLTETGGAYSFTGVAAGNYKLNARMAPGFSGHYGDTWYDEEEPSSDGIFGSDADVLYIDSGEVLTGLDITLPLTGGFHGMVITSTGTPLSSVWVRAESRSDYRYHHNDLTKNYVPRIGEFSMRGLRDNHDFRLIIYDPQGRYETEVVDDVLSVTTEQDYDTGAFPLQQMGSDPNEPNNSASEATEIPALPFESNGAVIYPRGSDVDWYCLDVDRDDRLLARAESRIDVDGVERRHPWFDPIMSLWTGDGSELIMWNDDDPNENTLSSFIDTGPLEEGRYCFVVSTYGDQDWTGTGQQTAGSYTFDVEMGNRPPYIEVTLDDDPVPEAPETITVMEGEDVTFEFTFGDPDGDSVEVEVELVDNLGDPVDGDLDLSLNSGSFDWSVSEAAAQYGPYELVFYASDWELTTEYRVIVEVEALNFPPTIPIPEWPIGGMRVDMHEVPLTVINATDPDGDDLTYEYELHIDDIEGDPDQEGSVAEDPSGTTEWVTATLPENAFVSWRVRAFDGNVQSGYSPWSEWEFFLVDTVNFPPEAPQILKPEPNEIVLTRTPRISSTIPEDPEGDPVSIVFEVAATSEFDDVLAASDPVPAPEQGTADTVEWTTDPALERGEYYYVRAKAIDDRGGESDWSSVVAFFVQSGSDAPAPGFSGEMGNYCEGGYGIGDGVDTIVVDNVDHSGAALEFQLQIHRDEELLYEIFVPQSQGEQTEIPVDDSIFTEEGGYRVRVRSLLEGRPGEWSECLLLVGSEGGDGDGDGDGNGDGDGDGDSATSPEGEGCGCTATGGPESMFWAVLLLMAVAAGRLRRRRRRGGDELAL